MRLLTTLCVFVAVLAASADLNMPGIKVVLTNKILPLLSGLQKEELARYESAMSLSGFHVGDQAYEVTLQAEPDRIDLSFIPNEELKPREVNEDPCRSSGELVNTEMVGQYIGGLKSVVRGFNFEVAKVGENPTFMVQQGNFSLSMFLGQVNGALKLGRIQMIVLDHGILPESENKCVLKAKIIDEMVAKMAKTISEGLAELPVLVNLENKAVYDSRLILHPQVTPEAAELRFVGRFIYDETNAYANDTYSNLKPYFTLLSLFRDEQEPPKKEQRYTERFVLYDNDATLNTDALALEGSDEEEELKRNKAHLKLYVHQDLFNSLYNTMLKSKWLSLRLDRNMIESIVESYDDFLVSEEAYDTDLLPEDLSLKFHLYPLEEGGKMQVLEDAGVRREQIAFGITYKGLTADYLLKSEMKGLLRDGRMAYDRTKLVVTKEADEGFPRLVNTENLKRFFDIFTNHTVELLQEYLIFITESRHENNYSILGLDLSILDQEWEERETK